ncbi:hypothetical protein BV20DRAFT_584549 [Pilatotrama ljubarskyi]|nr:hypothetical protein BV20DRAFT_584549 [Pilatotrama ljubarskyi]
MASPEQATPPVPGEITDAIIDHLHDSRETLLSCALVCSAWLPSSRHHLFGFLSSGPEKAALTDLLDFVTSTPHVASHVRHFLLYGYQGLSLKNIVTLIDALPNVRIVELDKVFLSYPLRYEPPLRASVKELSALRIAASNVTDLDFNNLFRLLGLFTVMRTLRLEQSSSRHFFAHPDFEIAKVDTPQSLQVAALSVAFMPPSLIVQLVCPSRMAHWETLRSLEIDQCIEQWTQVAHIGHLLSEIGPRLRTLALKPSYRLQMRQDYPGGLPGALVNQPAPAHIDTRSRWEPLNLSKCTNLDVFTLDLSYGDQSPMFDVHVLFKMNVDILSLLPKGVHCVKARIVPISPFQGTGIHPNDPGATLGGPLHSLNWPVLDETLSDVKFEHSRIVLDMTEMKPQYTEQQFHAITAFLTGSLHRVRRRRRLEFEVRPRTWWD